MSLPRRNAKVSQLETCAVIPIKSGLSHHLYQRLSHHRNGVTLLRVYRYFTTDVPKRTAESRVKAPLTQLTLWETRAEQGSRNPKTIHCDNQVVHLDRFVTCGAAKRELVVGCVGGAFTGVFKALTLPGEFGDWTDVPK